MLDDILLQEAEALCTRLNGRAGWRVVTDLADRVRDLLFHREALLFGIRRHRDYRGDDRCFLDDAELYNMLPEGDTRPPSDTAVTIENCQRFIACRQQDREYVSPQREIERLTEANAEAWMRGWQEGKTVGRLQAISGIYEYLEAQNEALPDWLRACMEHISKGD